MKDFNSFKKDLIQALHPIEQQYAESVETVEKITDQYFHEWANSGKEGIILPDPVMTAVVLKLNDALTYIKQAQDLIGCEWYNGVAADYIGDFQKYTADQSENEMQ